MSYQGKTPLFVMATSGTTVLGAFDDLNAVADVCEKHKVWMHVDVSNEIKANGLYQLTKHQTT